MFEDRADVAEADEDGGRGRDGNGTYVIKDLVNKSPADIRAYIIEMEKKYKVLARITITNMFVAMINSLRDDVKSELITNTFSRIPYQYRNTRIVKTCLTDAARICNVIIQPGYSL